MMERLLVDPAKCVRVQLRLPREESRHSGQVPQYASKRKLARSYMSWLLGQTRHMCLSLLHCFHLA